MRSTASGIAALGQRYVGWGTAFIDVDLDGWEDLFVVNGHAIRYPLGTTSRRKQQAVLLLNVGGKFRVAEQTDRDYSQTPHLGRGVGFGDLDNDGRIDLVISHLNEPVTILRGIGGRENHWLGVSWSARITPCGRGQGRLHGQRATPDSFCQGGRLVPVQSAIVACSLAWARRSRAD